MNQQKLARESKKWAVSIGRAVFLVAFSVILLYPVLFMISNAVKTRADVINPAVEWIAREPSLYSFSIAFRAMEYAKSLWNTFRFELISAIIEVFSCAVYAYGLARFKFRMKPLLMFFLILVIFIPDIIMVIPRIINFRYMDFMGILGLVKNLGGPDLRPNLTDTVLTFYLPSIFGVGLKGGIFMFIYMQFFKGLPQELEEAAWIDGAGPFTTFLRIILPSSGVVLLTVAIFSIIWHWNDWLLAMMYTNENRTLAVQVYDIGRVIQRWASAESLKLDQSLMQGAPLAACLMFIAPPVALYLFLQKYFIQSIDRVGIVG